MEHSETIYYDDTSEIVEENNSWAMENVVIVENENLSWQENSAEVTINYADATENPEQTITENEIYISANGENSLETSIDQDKSEYYSILDTTYQGEDSYGENDSGVKIIVRVSEDEEILPDTDQHEDIQEDDEEKSQAEPESGLECQVFLYHTEGSDEMYAVQIADDGNGNLQRYKYKVRQTEDGRLEAIPGTIEVQVDDIIEKHISDCQNESAIQQENIIHENHLEIIENQHELQEQPDEETLISFEKPDFVAIKQEITENSNDTANTDEEAYGTPEYLLSENENDVDHENDINKNDTENVEVTPDIFENDNSIPEQVIEEKRHKFFKSKDPNNKNKIAVYRNDKRSYLLLDSIEKENVENNINSNIKTSRSLLKNTVLTAIEDKEIQDAISNILQDNRKKTSIRIINKSFKEHVDSTEVVNSNKKIAEKSVRQPRKQTIKPIERCGSEIIVQPMFYSFNNEEPLLIPMKRKYESPNVISEIVKVSDDSSDDDSVENPKPKKKKKTPKKPAKQIEQITISDSENSDNESIIEILTENSSKPRKNHSPTPLKDLESEKTDDIMQIQEAVNDIVQEREERNKQKVEESTKTTKLIKKSPIKKSNNIKCPKCPKTFPREINLKNHMNIHNARRSLRGKIEKPDTKIETKKPTKVIIENAKKDTYFCSRCKLKFMSETQLKRHLTIHVSSPKKLLQVRKSPLKIRKSVGKTLISDKRSVLDTKNVLSSPRRPFKCDQCSLSFSQKTLLTAHKIKHKNSCTKCNVKFSSKSLLDVHIAKKCNGTIKPKGDALKRKSILKMSPVKKTRFSNLFHSCSSCMLRFRSLEKLKEHELSAHKKVNLVKGVMKNVNTRSKRPHGGVPTSDRMQRAFDMMKMKS